MLFTHHIHTHTSPQLCLPFTPPETPIDHTSPYCHIAPPVHKVTSVTTLQLLLTPLHVGHHAAQCSTTHLPQDPVPSLHHLPLLCRFVPASQSASPPVVVPVSLLSLVRRRHSRSLFSSLFVGFESLRPSPVTTAGSALLSCDCLFIYLCLHAMCMLVSRAWSALPFCVSFIVLSFLGIVEHCGEVTAGSESCRRG